MSDGIKQYQVSYNVTATTKSATDALGLVGDAAVTTAERVSKIVTAISGVNSKLQDIKRNANFRPSVDVAGFTRELEVMETAAYAAVNNIRQMFHNLFNGAGNRSILPNGSNEFLGLPIKEIDKKISVAKGHITRAQKEIERIRGTKDLESDTYKNSHALIQEQEDKIANFRKTLTNLEAAKRLKVNYPLGQSLAPIAVEELQKQQATLSKNILGASAAASTDNKETKQKTPKGGGKASAKGGQNLHSEQLQQIQKTFGTGDSKTFTYTVDAKKAPTYDATIKTISESLNSLRGLCSLDITPSVNATAFTDVENKLSQLAKMSQAVVAPLINPSSAAKKNSPGTVLTTTEENNLKRAIEKKGKLEEQLAKQREDLKGFLTKKGTVRKGSESAHEQLTQSIAANEKSLKSATTTVTRLTNKKNGATPSNVTGKNTSGLQTIEVVAQISNVLPPAKPYELFVNAAIAPESITKSIESIKIPTIAANIKMQWGTGNESLQSQFKAATSKIPAIKLDLDPALALEKLNDFINTIKGRSPQSIALTASGATNQSGQSQSGGGTSISGVAGSGGVGAGSVGKSGGASSSSVDKSAAPQGLVGRGKNAAFFGKTKPDIPTPPGYRWAYSDNMSEFLTNPQLMGYENSKQRQANAIAKEDAANRKLSRYIDDEKVLTERLEKLKADNQNLGASLASIKAKRDADISKLNKHKKDNAGKTSAGIKSYQTKLQNGINAHDEQIAALQASEDEIKKTEKGLNQTRQKINEQRRVVSDLAADRNAPSKYMKGFKLTPIREKAPTPKDIKKLQRQLFNGVNKIVKNKDLANAVVNHKRAFARALIDYTGKSHPDLSLLGRNDQFAIAQQVRSHLLANNLPISSDLTSFIKDQENARDAARVAGLSKISRDQNAWNKLKADTQKKIEKNEAAKVKEAQRAEDKKARETAREEKRLSAQAAKEEAALNKEINKESKAKSKLSVSGHRQKAMGMLNDFKNALRPFTSNDTQLNQLTKYRRYFSQSARSLGFATQEQMTSFRNSFGRLPLEDQAIFFNELQQKMNKAGVGVPKFIQSHIDNINSQVSGEAAESKRLANQALIAQQRQVWDKLKADTQKKIEKNKAAKAKEAAKEKSAASKSSIKGHKLKAANMLSGFQKVISPFASSDGQAKQMAKYHRYFSQAARALGFDTPEKMASFQQSFSGLPIEDKAIFFDELQKKMANAGVAVPKPIQSHINSINTQLTGAAIADPKAVAPTGFVGTGAGRVQFGGARPDASTAPTGYNWTRTRELAAKLNPAQTEALGKASSNVERALANFKQVRMATAPTIESAKQVANQTEAVQTLREMGRENGRAITEAISARTATHREMASLRNEIDRQRSIHNNYEGENKTRIRAQAGRQVEHLQRIYADKSAKYGRQNDVVNSLIANGRNIQAETQSAVRSEMQRIIAPAVAQREAAFAPLKEAGKARNAYTDGWRLEKTPQRKAPDYRSLSAWNRIRPIAQSDVMAKAIMDNFSHVKGAIKSSGIVPYANMPTATRLSLMKKIVGNMTAASANVPGHFYDEVSRLEKKLEVEQRRNIAAQKRRFPKSTMPATMSTYDRFRKWGFPFSGATSFGSRPPMAFEMAKGMGMMFAVGGAMSAISNSFSQAMEYQNVMKSTQSILRGGTKTYSDAGFANMEGIVRDVGVKTKFSAPEVASAAKFLAMAGYDIDAINNSIRPIADLALIGDTDLGETADKMTNIMTTFNIKPENMRKAANIMVATATRSNTDLMMLAESAKYGGAVANMYGKGNPDIFAETMALFGIMGNSGIQGSSAGTALRMMYMNLFNPNKKQAALLAELKDKFKINVTDSKGRVNSLADIVMQMADQIPAEQQAKYVSKLFRITAQAGANSVISAADVSEEDKQGAIKGLGSIVEFVESDNGGVSKLKELIEANKAAADSNISSEYAEEKQNTLSGLLAQVTSMFTETIVQAMEKRVGSFSDMAKGVRDFFAKPETIQMMQNILDMITEIGKILGYVVKIWATLYGYAPGLIKFWVVTQMAFTQFGTLLSPFIQMSGAINRLRTAIGGFLGLPAMMALHGRSAGMGRSAFFAASGAMSTAPIVVGSRATAAGRLRGWIGGRAATSPIKVYGRTAQNLSKSLVKDPLAAITAATLLSPVAPMTRQGTVEAMRAPTALSPYEMHNRQIASANTANTARALTVAQRANNIFGAPRFKRNFMSTITWGLSALSWAPLLQWLKSAFFAVLGKLGTLFGVILNPITLTITGLTVLGFGLHRLTKYVNGTTDAQIRSQETIHRLINQSNIELEKINNWYKNFDSTGHKVPDVGVPGKSESSKNVEEQQKQRKSEWGFLGALSTDASKQSNEMALKQLRDVVNSDPVMSKFFAPEMANGMLSDKLLTPANTLTAPTESSSDFGGIWYLTARGGVHSRAAKDIEKVGVNIALAKEAEKYAPLLAALPKVAEVWSNFDKKLISSDDKTKQLNAIKAEVYNSLPHSNLSSPSNIATAINSPAPQIYGIFEGYVMTLLDSYINADPGTLPHKNTALQNILHSKAVAYSEEWYRNIGAYLQGMQVTAKILGPNNEVIESLQIALDTMDDGHINMTAFFNKISALSDKFQGDIRVYLNAVAGIYKMMAANGIVPDTKEGMTSYMNGEMVGKVLPKESIVSYFNDFVKTRPNHDLVKIGIGADQLGRLYENDVLKNHKKYSLIASADGSRKVKLDWQKFINFAAGHFVGGQVAEAYKSIVAPNNNGGTNVGDPTSNQDEYANSYGRDAAKPTQVIFNIQNLCSFDRTAIASNADEERIIEEMQPKVTNAVYQMMGIAMDQTDIAGKLT